MQYILLTRWPHTQYIFPQFATTRLSKIWFSRLTLISRYCYCDICIIIVIAIVIYVIIVVTSVRIRWYFVIFNRLSKRLKSISKFGMWDFEYCRHSVYSKIDKYISLSCSVHASSGSLPTLLIDSLKVALGASLFKQFEHLSRYANAFLRMQLMPTAQLMMPSLYLPAKCPLGIALSLSLIKSIFPVKVQKLLSVGDPQGYTSTPSPSPVIIKHRYFSLLIDFSSPPPVVKMFHLARIIRT